MALVLVPKIANFVEAVDDLAGRDVDLRCPAQHTEFFRRNPGREDDSRVEDHAALTWRLLNQLCQHPTAKCLATEDN